MDENVGQDDGIRDQPPARAGAADQAPTQAGAADQTPPWAGAAGQPPTQAGADDQPPTRAAAADQAPPWAGAAGQPPTQAGAAGQAPEWAGAAVQAPTRARTHRGATVAVAGSLALAVALGGVALGRDLGSRTTAGSGTAAAGSTTTGQFGPGTGFGGFGGWGGGTGGNGTNGNGGTGDGGTGDGTSGNGSGGTGDGTSGNGSGGTGDGTSGNGSGGTGDGTSGNGSGTTGTGTTRSATSAESTGVVDVTTVLDYGSGEAAGTGIVLTSGGEILTNNHVVDGATKITVTVVSTGRSYAASVVGTDPTDDVAVLRLAGASGLTPATLATSTVAVGDAVTAVGNAGGTGGTPTAATGTVVALGQSITASDETGSDAEQLTGLIETDAAIQPGDSGGPLYADGAVVGIDTAASSGQTVVGFAIPIGTATAIADRIEAGEDSGTIQQGTPAFLGVELANGTSAATIAGVVTGSPAADAGLQAGDTITAVDGTAVGSATALSSVLGKHQAGDQVRIVWTDGGGASHTATVTLVAGPAA